MRKTDVAAILLFTRANCDSIRLGAAFPLRLQQTKTHFILVPVLRLTGLKPKSGLGKKRKKKQCRRPTFTRIQCIDLLTGVNLANEQRL